MLDSKLTEKSEIEYGEFKSTDIGYVSYLGTQILIKIGKLVTAHIRVRLPQGLKTGAYIGTVNFLPGSNVQNLVFYNQLDNTMASVLINTSGEIILQANASAGCYFIDVSYICKS